MIFIELFNFFDRVNELVNVREIKYITPWKKDNQELSRVVFTDKSSVVYTETYAEIKEKISKEVKVI